jgi:ABC-type multidrug transport system fused ATPase/permease subunit
MEKDSPPKRMASIKELYANADCYDILYMALGTLGGIVSGISIPFFNVLFGTMINALNTDPASFATRVKQIALSFVYVSIVNIFAGTLQIYYWTKSGEKQTQKIREKYIKAILKQEIGWFDTNNPSELSTRVADQIGDIQDGIGQRSGDIVQYASQFIASFVVGFYLSWKLVLVLCCCIPCIAFCGYLMISAYNEAKVKTSDQYAGAGGLANEAISQIRTVTALNAQPDIISKYRVFLFDAMYVGIQKSVNIGIGNGSIFAAVFFTYSLGYYYGGILVANSVEHNNDEITGGMVVSTFFAVIMGSIAIGQITTPIQALSAARTSLAGINDVINRNPIIDNCSNDGVVPATKLNGNISIQELRFAYPTRESIEICKGYNLHISVGETVALVGRSGCGKSTIMNLLLRFYDPASGTICIDNMNIKELNIKYLRSLLGYVGQEPILFQGSIYDNILYGIDSDNMDKEELLTRVIKAAKLANCHDFIMTFPLGYDTDVGVGGISMSGGQKQRISIARALIKQPIILLLDEATSALDSVSEKIVQESIDQLASTKAQTTIIIAHRLSTIRNADKIAVIDNGLVAEIGNHDELLSRNGIYADLVSLQLITAGSSVVDNLAKKKEASVDDTVTKVASTTGKAKESVAMGKETLSIEESRALSKKVWAMIYEHYVWLILALLGAAIYGTIFPMWGLVLAHSQNMFYYNDPNRIRSESAQQAKYFLTLAFGALISCILQYYCIGQMSERVALQLRSTLFQSILRREIAYFDSPKNTLTLLTNRLSNDSRTVNKATGETIVKTLQAFFTLGAGLVIGMTACYKIALVTMATFPFSVTAQKLRLKAIAGQNYDDDKVENNVNDISSAFTHMRTVNAFSMQDKIFCNYAAATRLVADDRSKRGFLAGVAFGLANSSQYLTYALLFWYGSTLISAGDVTFVNMMTSLLSLMMGAVGLGSAINEMGDQQEGYLAAKRIFQSSEEGEKSLIDSLSKDGIVPATPSRGNIEFKNVNFRYPERLDYEVCKSYSFSVKEGEVVALVGPSGGGKSSIMSLLLRFYDPTSGEILLDGVNIKDLNVRWLRSQCGYVGQEPALFKGSIAENISKGRKEYGNMPLLSMEDAMVVAEQKNKENNSNTCKLWDRQSAKGDAVSTEDVNVELGVPSSNEQVDDDIKNACVASHAHEFITSFTDGYHTDVGEGSILVSGGQKQRIAIARALISDPSILLFDEATSALDAASEKLVQQSIDSLQSSHKRTTIIIAHRLTTIKNADKIIVVTSGEIKEIGRHEELLSKNGLYAELWNKQDSASVATE